MFHNRLNLCHFAFFTLQIVKFSFTTYELFWVIPFKVSSKCVSAWEVPDPMALIFIRSFISMDFPTLHTVPRACIFVYCAKTSRKKCNRTQKITLQLMI